MASRSDLATSFDDWWAWTARQQKGLSPITSTQLFTNARQIRFIEMVIEYLTRNGVMDPSLLYEPPYTDLDDAGLDGLFDDKQADRIVQILTAIQVNAEPMRESA